MQLIMDNLKDMEDLQEKELREINGGFILTAWAIIGAIGAIATVATGTLYYKGYSDGVKAREAEAAVAN